MALWIGVAPAALAQQQATDSESIPARQLTDDLYVLENGIKSSGGNIVVFVGPDAVLIVDSKVASFSEQTIAAVKKLSDKPVRYVINTHCHGDHVGGNAAFQRTGAIVIARSSVYRRLQPERRIECERGGVGSPDVTFDSAITLHIGNEEISVVPLSVGHTDGDAYVYFRRANVVHVGDAFYWPVPFHSGGAGGKALDLPNALRTIVQSVPEDAKVIPGHGRQATMADLRRAITILDEVRAVMVQQIGAGRTLDEMKTAKVFDRWKDLLGGEFDWTLKSLYEALAEVPAEP